MQDLWQRLERFFAAQQWPVALRPGATEAEIAAAEAALGLPLPADLRASLRIHDGEDWQQWRQCIRWMIHDTFLLSLNEILKHWNLQQTCYAQWGEEYADDYQDEGRIRNVIFHPRRIPIAMNLGEESGLWLDFTPGPAGVAGQVIMDITECDFIVLAPTFHAFLTRYLELLETDVYFYEPETYGYVIPQNLEALHSGAVWQDDFYRRMFPLNRACDLDNITLETFLARLPTIPWFACVGQPIADPDISRIWNWDEWAGPEEETGRIVALSLRHQDWHDALLAAYPEREAELEALWQQVEAAVTAAAAAAQVPYDPDADSWHAPTAAVWQAKWTAGLIAWHLACGESIPLDLAQQWDWYARGHWPCGYVYIAKDETPGPLQIY